MAHVLIKLNHLYLVSVTAANKFVPYQLDHKG